MWSALLLGSLLTILSALHLYWAFGGSWGRDAVIPLDDGRPILKIGFFSCLAVAVLLALAAVLCFSQAFPGRWMSAKLSRYGLWAMTVVFTLRAIGEFRYVGFFKRVKGSRFARLDTLLFSPLCLLMAALAFASVLTTSG